MDYIKLKQLFNESLILNPTENVYPLLSCMNFTKGLYIPQFGRDESSNIIFGGRSIYQQRIEQICDIWKQKLNADFLTFALLSGMHACILVFMSIGASGDKAVILPVEAGGHFATKPILNRLGYRVYEAVCDNANMRVDIDATLKLIEKTNPDFIFIERSDGLVYEDFSWIRHVKSDCYKVFDASQYLTSIILGEYKSPFEMGFNMIVSTVHKDFPGTQQAFAAADNSVLSCQKWKQLVSGMSRYASSIHPKEIFNSLYFLQNIELLNKYSRLKHINSLELYKNLFNLGVPVVPKTGDEREFTQHIWIKSQTQQKAYADFSDLEKLNLLVNYFNIPYGLGRGLRLGTGAATLQGLRSEHISELALIIADVVYENQSDIAALKRRADGLIGEIKLKQNEIIKF